VPTCNVYNVTAYFVVTLEVDASCTVGLDLFHYAVRKLADAIETLQLI